MLCQTDRTERTHTCINTYYIYFVVDFVCISPDGSLLVSGSLWTFDDHDEIVMHMYTLKVMAATWNGMEGDWRATSQTAHICSEKYLAHRRGTQYIAACPIAALVLLTRVAAAVVFGLNMPYTIQYML